MVMKVVSVINNKGGVGKTTVTANLGSYAASRNRRVLMIDVDPQTNLTFSFMSDYEWKTRCANKTMLQFLSPIINNGPSVALESLVTNISLFSTQVKFDLICSHSGLVNLDISLAQRLGESGTEQSAENFLTVFGYIKNALDNMKRDETYDLVLIDCPSSFNIVTKAAFAASDYYVVPVQLDQFSLSGLDLLTKKNASSFIEEYNSCCQQVSEGKNEAINPQNIGVLPVMVSYAKGTTLIKAQSKVVAQLKKDKQPLFETYIQDNPTFFQAAQEMCIPAVLSPINLPIPKTIKTELAAIGDEFIKRTGI
jgi:chromosome partitioning protein